MGDDVGSLWCSRQPRAGGGHYVSSPSPHSGCTGLVVNFEIAAEAGAKGKEIAKSSPSCSLFFVPQNSPLVC